MRNATFTTKRPFLSSSTASITKSVFIHKDLCAALEPRYTIPVLWKNYYTLTVLTFASLLLFDIGMMAHLDKLQSFC